MRSDGPGRITLVGARSDDRGSSAGRRISKGTTRARLC